MCHVVVEEMNLTPTAILSFDSLWRKIIKTKRDRIEFLTKHTSKSRKSMLSFEKKLFIMCLTKLNYRLSILYDKLDLAFVQILHKEDDRTKSLAFQRSTMACRG